MRRLLVVFLVFLSVSTHAQKTGYEIEFNIEGCQQGTALLAYYYGDKQYIKDSTKIDASGKFVFTGDQNLDQGIYITVMPPDNKYFEVIIDSDQHFSMASKYRNPVKDMKVVGNEENERFYTYLNFLEEQKAKSQPFTEKAKKLQEADSLGYKDSKEFKKLQEEMTAVDEEVKAYKNRFIEDNPDALLY
jgi:hypothetical protein